MERDILHADMNNCYASIELIDHPEWRGLPLAVCGSEDDRHGIVLAKSQEAKVLGVKTGEAIWQAKEKCPKLLVVPPHYEKYLEYSRKTRAIYQEYTPQVEPFGLDECWLDVTGCDKLFGTPLEIANELRERMKTELGLTISVGVSFTKHFAKLGSDMKKPDAVTVIPKDKFKEIVWPLDVQELMGIGRATTRKLNRYGVKTLGQLAQLEPSLLKSWLGVNGIKLWKIVNGFPGERVRYVGETVPIKTIGNGITLRDDLKTVEEVRGIFIELAQKVSHRLHENEFCANGVQITVRDTDLISRQFQTGLRFPTQSGRTLAEKATELFEASYHWHRYVRSLTVRAIDLQSTREVEQLCFLEDYAEHDRAERLDQALYELRNRYGKTSILFMSQMLNHKLPQLRSDVVTLPNAKMN